MKGLVKELRKHVALSWVVIIGSSVVLDAKVLEYQTPVTIRSQEFNRSLVVKAEFEDENIKQTDTAAPFKFVAVNDDDSAAKDGSSIVILKSAATPDKTGPVNYNDIFIVEAVKAGTGAWTDKTGFFSKRRLLWTFPGSKWNDESTGKDAPHFQPRVSDDLEPALKTDAINFTITSPVGKMGSIEQDALVNIVSRASGPSNNRMMWVLNLDQNGTLPVLISSDDPWGRDPKSGLDGDRRIKAGQFTLAQIDTQLLNDQGWQDLGKLVPEGKIKPGGQYAASGRNFVYEPAIFGRGNAAFSESWKGEKPGTMWVQFRARAKSDVIVQISTQPKWMDAAGTYCFFFGSYKNTRTQIRKGTQLVVEVDVNKGGDPTALVSGGLPNNGSMWDDYWVSVEQNEDGKALLSAGKGQKIGEQVKISWVDEQPLKFVQYFGLSGWDTLVEFDKIVQSGKEQITLLPPDFVQIPGTVTKISLGLDKKGNVLVYGLGEKGSLLKWDHGSIKPIPWDIVEVKTAQGAKLTNFLDVAAAADGTMLLVTNKRRAYRYNPEKDWWEIIPNKLKGNKKKKVSIDSLAVGNAGTILGLDKKTKTIYLLLSTDEWLVISEGECLSIAAGYDGSIYALNTKKELFSWEKSIWKRIDTVQHFTMISALSRTQLFGAAREENKARAYVLDKGNWEVMQTADGNDVEGLQAIYALPTKPAFMLLVDERGNVYRKGEVLAALDDAIKIGLPDAVVNDAATAEKEHKKKHKKKKTSQKKENHNQKKNKKSDHVDQLARQDTKKHKKHKNKKNHQYEDKEDKTKIMQERK